jgi:hypothetical protein
MFIFILKIIKKCKQSHEFEYLENDVIKSTIENYKINKILPQVRHL